MRPPSPADYVLGNRVVTVSLLLADFYGLYFATALQGSWMFFLLCVALTVRAGRGRSKVVEYRAWAHTWDQMSAPDPGMSASSRAAKTQGQPRSSGGRGLRLALVLPVWALTLTWLKLHAAAESRTDNFLYIEVGFLALSFWVFRTLFLPMKGWVGRARRSVAGQAGAGFIVRVLPGVPSHSPDLARIRAGLPDYAKALLAQGNPASRQQAARADRLQWN